MKHRSNIPVIHPILFAIYPTLSLLSANISQTPIMDAFRIFFISICVSAVLFALLGLLLRKWQHAGLVCTLWVLLFFTYGLVYKSFQSVVIGGVWIGRANVLAALWATIFIIGTWAIIRLLHQTKELTVIINVISLAAICFCFVNILSFEIRNAGNGNLKNDTVTEKGMDKQEVVQTAGSISSTPDIYYIILDGYGRSDILKEIYGADNSDFIDFLKSKGFYVAEESHSNYNQTALTISSALNYHYLNELVQLNPESDNREPARELVNNSLLLKDLRSRGYQVIAFDTWYFVTQMKSADIYYPNVEQLNPFENMLLTNSAAIFWVDKLASIERWKNYLNSFENLYNTVDIQLNGPKFVFAHMIIPHPPFVFNQDGSMGTFMGTGEGTMFSGNRADYFNGYTNQMIYANKVFKRIIEHILNSSKTKPIIIIQADHGPGAYLDWENPEKSCIKERFSILSAYYYPEGIPEALYSSITPVNTFRVLLNETFDANMPLEPDRSYFSSVNYPFRFLDVTNRVNKPCDLTQGLAVK